MTVAAYGCINCRFFMHQVGNGEWFKGTDGMCRRYAPSGPTTGAGSWSIFPPMNSDQWCGDYRPANEAKADARRVAA